jgi:hypothetical protein
VEKHCFSITEGSFLKKAGKILNFFLRGLYYEMNFKDYLTFLCKKINKYKKINNYSHRNIGINQVDVLILEELI